MIRRSLFTAIVLLAACHRDPDSYTVGAAGPWKESYGIMTRRGIDLAVEEINHAGGIRGAPFRVIARDDDADARRATSIAQEFVRDRHVLAVIGHVTSGAMLAAAKVYDGELTAVATSASSPDLTGVSPWIFRVISSDSLNGVGLGRFASQIGGTDPSMKRAAVLYENDSYGRGLADSFRRNFRGTIVSFDPINDALTDAEPFVSFFAMTKPGIVFVASRDQAALAILREAKRQNLNTLFLGGDGWQSIISDTAASDGAYVGTSFNTEDSSPSVRRFVRAFEKRYDMPPDAFAALGYDAAMLVARAIAKKGGDRKAVRDYIASLDAEHPFEGIGGSLYFSEGGDPLGMGFRVARVSHGTLLTGVAQ
ncbi:MAG TPA: ABC transporter substrate-binding protein [Gemmatimonadaceae bacterium]|nr:ABC transporter substrate-binding protein [Gemmatimonadaceae bacterium]